MDSNVPDAVLESARLDGSSEVSTFFKIAMPMVKPAWLTLMIFSIVGVAFGTNPYTSLLGIIFSAIARGMVRRFREAGYQIGPAGLAKKAKVSGIFAKVGSIVSIVGLILSIVMFVILIIIIAVLAITAAVKSGR